MWMVHSGNEVFLALPPVPPAHPHTQDFRCSVTATTGAFFPNAATDILMKSIVLEEDTHWEQQAWRVLLRTRWNMFVSVWSTWWNIHLHQHPSTTLRMFSLLDNRVHVSGWRLRFSHHSAPLLQTTASVYRQSNYQQLITGTLQGLSKQCGLWRMSSWQCDFPCAAVYTNKELRYCR